MSPVIRVPEDLYFTPRATRKNGFDTPANVIETLLNHFEGVDQKASKAISTQDATKKRDTTKYSFKNKQYGKGKLVLAVVKDYVTNNPKITFDNLLKVFPKNLQGSIGVFNEHGFVQKKYEDKSHKRHYLKINEIISLSDCNIVVCTEWGAGDGDNISGFVEHAKSIGFNITAKNG